METNLLLETYLKALRLPTFLRNYRKFAEDAAQANLSYDRFLLALAEQEIGQRERNRTTRRIKAARFPVLKELADFDFSCISSPHKQRVLELAQGSYVQKVEDICKLGDEMLVKLLSVDDHGKIRLSRKAVLRESQGPSDEGRREGNRPNEPGGR